MLTAVCNNNLPKAEAILVKWKVQLSDSQRIQNKQRRGMEERKKKKDPESSKSIVNRASRRTQRGKDEQKGRGKKA